MALREHELKNAYIGEYGWKPGVNTLAYYPLVSDFSNDWWTIWNLTSNGTNTFVDDNISTINVCRTWDNGRSYLIIPNHTIPYSWYSILLWARCWYIGEYIPHIIDIRTSGNEFWWIQWYSSNGYMQLWTDYPSFSYNRDSAIANTSNYDLWSIVFSQWTLKFYKNNR